MSADTIPDWVTFPGGEWTEITPQEAGLDVAAWRRAHAVCTGGTGRRTQ